jgi:hypothetical protein
MSLLSVAECCDYFNVMLKVVMLNVIVLNVVMLNVIVLNVVMPNVIMLNVVMLSVVAEFFQSLSGTLWLIWHKHHLTK